jgi:hypothetical protein
LDLLAWMPMLALTDAAGLWEPRRLRLFSAAAQLVTTGRRCFLRLAQHWPWTDVIASALARLMPSQTPADQQHPVPASSTPRSRGTRRLAGRDSRAIKPAHKQKFLL